MTIEMILLNVGVMTLLTLLMENGLRKTLTQQAKSVTNTYWFYLFPTYILSIIFSVLILFPNLESNFELLLELQRYSIGFHVVFIILFLAAMDGAKMIAKASSYSDLND